MRGRPQKKKKKKSKCSSPDIRVLSACVHGVRASLFSILFDRYRRIYRMYRICPGTCGWRACCVRSHFRRIALKDSVQYDDMI